MGEAQASKTALSRRSFLKTAGVASALAAAGGMTGCDGWLTKATPEAGKGEYVGYTFHQNHCTGHCSLKCTVRDGRLVKIEPNDAANYDKRYRICCARALSEIQHVYSADRIQTPLRRIDGAERGEGKFEAISWDEAMAEIKEKLGAVWANYGKDAVIVAGTSDVKVRYPFLKQIFNAQQDGRTGVDVGVGNGLGPMIGDSSSFVICTSEARDWSRSKFVLLTSTNFLESSLPSAKTFYEAQEAGAEIVSVDTFYTVTASKANEWVPINAGTDGALFQGMITAILDNAWYDEASMKSGTSFPFLIEKSTGAMLRQTETDNVAQKGADNPYLVWDSEAGTTASYLECENPALEGEWIIDGKTYTTAFELLKASQKSNKFTLAWAEDKTGIPAAKIEELARKYANNTPATLSVGWGGSDKYMNSDITGHAMGILAALTGNYGKPGASVGCHVGGNYCGWSAGLGSWPLPSQYKLATQEMASYLMRTRENKVRAYIALGDMFQQHYCNMNVTKEWLKKLDFIVYVDIYHTTSADWADIVLPACSKFETTEEVEYLKVAYGHVLGQGKVLEPLFEAKTDLEIERLLAKTMGVAQEDGTLPKTSMEYVDYQISHSSDAKLQGLTLQKLIANQNVWPIAGIENIRETYASQIAKTTSGRLDVYQEKRLGAGQALPVYEDNDELYPGNPLREKYPLHFYQARTKYLIHSMFCDATWIQQFYTPHVQMTAEDMADRGLVNGDIVEVYNDRGSIQVPVKQSNILPPHTVRIYEGQWTKFMVKGNLQELTNDKLSSREAILQAGTSTPNNDTLCEVKKA